MNDIFITILIGGTGICILNGISNILESIEIVAKNQITIFNYLKRHHNNIDNYIKTTIDQEKNLIEMLKSIMEEEEGE